MAQAGIGTIDYSVPEDARAAAILSQARDGLHQIGTTRMSTDPTTGVVDTDCRVHGLQNLYVASTSVMPGSKALIQYVPVPPQLTISTGIPDSRI